MGPLGAFAAEPIHVVDARGALAAGVGGTLVNVDVASLPCREGGQFLSSPQCWGCIRPVRCILCRYLHLHRLNDALGTERQDFRNKPWEEGANGTDF